MWRTRRPIGIGVGVGVCVCVCCCVCGCGCLRASAVAADCRGLRESSRHSVAFCRHCLAPEGLRRADVIWRIQRGPPHFARARGRRLQNGHFDRACACTATLRVLLYRASHLPLPCLALASGSRSISWRHGQLQLPSGGPRPTGHGEFGIEGQLVSPMRGSTAPRQIHQARQPSRMPRRPKHRGPAGAQGQERGATQVVRQLRSGESLDYAAHAMPYAQPARFTKLYGGGAL